VRKIKEDLAKSELATAETGSSEVITSGEEVPAAYQDLSEETSSAPEPVEETGRIVIDTSIQDLAVSQADFTPTPETAPIPESAPVPESAPIPENSPVPESVSPSPIEGISEAPQSESPSHSASWPAPEVLESKVGEMLGVAAPSAPLQEDQTTSLPNPFAAAPAPSESEESTQVSPPEPKIPAGLLVDPSSGFEVDPPQQPNPGENESAGDSSEKSADRVDDLLKQFRERYGKS
jgi:hypothetical protein